MTDQERHASPTFGTPPFFDTWISASALQKAVRRGDIDLAEQAAAALLAFRGKNTWRRFLIIAFEDIGIASIETVADVVAFCRDPKLRANAGGDEASARHLARLLANTEKNRSVDLLMAAIRNHPSLQRSRDSIGSMNLNDRLAVVANRSAGLYERALATWFSSGIEWEREHRVGKGDLGNLLATFGNLGAPEKLCLAVSSAALRTREPMTVLLPLLWLLAAGEAEHTVVDSRVRSSRTVAATPLHVFDKHTRLGKTSIVRLACENSDIRRILETTVAKPQRSAAVCVAAFYADGAPVTRRRVWSLGDEIEKLGVEGDLWAAGVPLDAVDPLITTVKNNLDHLDDIREQLLLTRLKSLQE